MAEYDFLVKLTHFANTSWPSVRVGHSIGAFDEKYPCANPDGPVDNSECPDDDPLCNCPCQELNPSHELIDFPWYVDMITGFGLGAGIWNALFGNNTIGEPTKGQLLESTKAIKECDLIESKLGEDWMGCLWKNQDHPSSCNCPCVGENFKDYIEYTRTSATYWDTPTTTPLWRDAQMMLIKSQISTILLQGDLTLRPGELINITNKNPSSDKERRFSGRWLVADVSHIIYGSQHKMWLTLVRDSSPIDPETSEELGFFASVLSWLFG